VETLKAIVLAAGLGTRMGEIAAEIPKGMVSFIGQPLLQRQAAVLKAAGLTDIVIVGGYRAEKLEELGLPLVVNELYEETNMVYSLFCAEEQMRPDEDLIIAYGDIVYEQRVLEALLSCRAPLCIVVDSNWREYWNLRMEDPLADAETLKLVDGSRITELGKKAKDYSEIQGQYIGLIKVAGEQVERFKKAWATLDRKALYDGRMYKTMFMTSFLQYLIDSGWEARAVLVGNGWLEFDTEADLELYERLYKEGRLGQFYKL
jgi:L-glutamine-phosphate cytidylyltransferase